MARIFKDLIVAEPDAKPRVTLRNRDGSVALGEVTVELSSQIQQAGDAWSAACANALLQLSDTGAPVPRTDNPHRVTAAQVGLGAVNNTKDADKTVSKALYAVRDEAGNNLMQSYGASLAVSGNDMQLKAKNGAVLSSLIPNYAANAANLIFRQGKAGHITSPVHQQIYFSASGETNYEMFLGAMNGGWRLTPVTNARLELGDPSKRWNQGFFVNAPNVSSDRRLKQDIAPLDSRYTQLLLRLPTCRYRLIEDSAGGYHCGFIAQDVEALLAKLKLAPEEFTALVKSPVYRDVQVLESIETQDAEGEIVEAEILADRQLLVPDQYTYSLRYEEFISPLLALVQTQEKRLTALEQRLSALETN